MTLKVLISGAGIGGLALAQGLRRSGIDVAVFERDAAIDSRAQGYRIRMDADGDDALRSCLPADLFALYEATTSLPATPPSGAFNQNLEMFYRFDQPPTPAVAPSARARANSSSTFARTPKFHLTVNRHTLRQILVSGLERSLHCAHAVPSAEQNADSVRVRFANGKSATGDVLVAAEGINSPLRAQLLPHVQILDLGMTCIYGRIPLAPELFAGLPEPLRAGFTPILGPNRFTLGLGPFRQRQSTRAAAAQFAPYVAFDPIDDYLMWILVAPHPQVPQNTSPKELHETALSLTSSWHPELRRLLALADASATFSIPVRTSQRIDPWPSSRITFLGDAIHAMTPAGGIGANTALRDAALLSYLLAHAQSDSISLSHAIECYESEMRAYAFPAVERSLAGAINLYQLSNAEQRGA
jgi:salicylate hydroxylase